MMKCPPGAVGLVLLICGCTAANPAGGPQMTATLDAYRAAAARRAAPRTAPRAALTLWLVGSAVADGGPVGSGDDPSALRTQRAAATRPVQASVPGYWCDSLGEQAAAELRLFAGESFWSGFRTAFWDLENAAALAAAFGASLAIRETGVDATIARRVRRHRQLGDFDEPIQLLGNPGTHFAATGVLWLASALARDEEKHELARTLTRSLAVTGATTVLLKLSANTSAPDGGRYAWPSGHTSSSFALAAVLSEYYGPKVGLPALALAGLVGYQRLDSRVHDFSDVVFGAMLGWVVGSSIAREDRASPPVLLGMQVIPYADPQAGVTGIALRKSW